MFDASKRCLALGYLNHQQSRKSPAQPCEKWWHLVLDLGAQSPGSEDRPGRLPQLGVESTETNGDQAWNHQWESSIPKPWIHLNPIHINPLGPPPIFWKILGSPTMLFKICFKILDKNPKVESSLSCENIWNSAGSPTKTKWRIEMTCRDCWNGCFMMFQRSKKTSEEGP